MCRGGGSSKESPDAPLGQSDPQPCSSWARALLPATLDAAAKATSDESLPEPSEPIYAPLEEALPIYRGSGEHPDGTAVARLSHGVAREAPQVAPDGGADHGPLEVTPHRTRAAVAMA